MEPQLPIEARLSPEVVREPARQLPPRRGGGAGRWLLRFLLLVVVGFVGMAVLGLIGLKALISVAPDSGVQEKYHSLERLATDKVAIITLEGAILDGDGFVKKQIDRVRDDEHVKAIVLRVNSPGGTVTGSDYLYHHLSKLSRERGLPLVVSMGGIAASGGYYVSMAVGDTPDTVFAEPTTWTGSIGVVIPHYNLAGLLEKWNVEEDSIKSHRLKQMGSPTKPMTEEERTIFQALVDDSFGRFKEIIKSGRPAFRQNEAALEAVATGQVFTTRQALAHGLVDKEGFLEEAIDRAIALAGLDKGSTKVVEYQDSLGLLNLMLGARAQTATADLAALLDLTAPRAYYLCTWLPPIATSARP